MQVCACELLTRLKRNQAFTINSRSALNLFWGGGRLNHILLERAACTRSHAHHSNSIPSLLLFSLPCCLLPFAREEGFNKIINQPTRKGYSPTHVRLRIPFPPSPPTCQYCTTFPFTRDKKLNIRRKALIIVPNAAWQARRSLLSGCSRRHDLAFWHSCVQRRQCVRMGTYVCHLSHPQTDPLLFFVLFFYSPVIKCDMWLQLTKRSCDSVVMLFFTLPLTRSRNWEHSELIALLLSVPQCWTLSMGFYLWKPRLRWSNEVY